MRLEVAVGTDAPDLAIQFAEINKLVGTDKIEVMGPLLVQIGLMWTADAARARGRDAAFDHNRRRSTKGKEAK